MSASHEDEREESSERWLVSYADFITLLFAFFAVLYATSERNVEKTQKFQDSVKRYLIKAGAFGGSGDKIQQGEKYNSPIEPPIQTYQTQNEKQADIQKQLEEFVEAHFQSEQKTGFVLDISSDELGVRLSLSANKIFADGSAQLKPSAIEPLKKLGSFLQSLKHRLLIEGHATNAAIKSHDFASEWEFASLRATTLLRYLIKIHKIPSENILAASRGSERPLVPPQAPQAFQKNNRVDVVILGDDSPL